MKFVIIFGPPAVGKMTVGYELAKLTGFKLFHNHMTAELVLNFFDFGNAQFYRVLSELRIRFFEEVAAADWPGLIFTYVWALDRQSDREFIERSYNIFYKRKGETYFVELEADLIERLRRNESQFRLSQKPSKRDLKKSKEQLLEEDKKHKLNSEGDFFYKDNYIKINNSNISANETARYIINKFSLSTVHINSGS